MQDYKAGVGDLNRSANCWLSRLVVEWPVYIKNCMFND
ncbi:hypothetical protein [Methylomonas albis]|nr:hypothetical protein [Methylomonas albis]